MTCKRIQLWSSLLLVACGGVDYVDFQEQHVVSEQPSEPSGGQGAGGMGQGAGVAEVVSLLRGGYAGGLLTVEALAVGDYGSMDPVCSELRGIVYDLSTCRAGSICALPCTSDADCHGTKVDPSGTTSIVPGECQVTLDQNRCRYPCDVDTDCPSGMICDETEAGRSCLFPDTLYGPGCTDTFCVAEGHHYSVYGDLYYCDADTPCCDGLSCSPSGTCQERACLEAFWSCSDAPVDCCDGLSCQDGYCQPE